MDIHVCHPASHRPEGQVTTPAVRVRGARRTFHRRSRAGPALRGVDFDVQSGEFVAVMGLGLRKSTLLNVIAVSTGSTRERFEVDGERS